MTNKFPQSRERIFELDTIYFTIIILPVMVFIGGLFLYAEFGWNQCYNIGPSDTCLHPEDTPKILSSPSIHEASYRAHALTTVLLFTAVSILIILMFVADTIALFGRRAIRRFAIWASPITGVIILLIIFDKKLSGGVRWIKVSAQDFIGHKFVFDEAWGSVSLHEGSNKTLYALSANIISFVAIMMAISVAILAVGSISCLAQTRSNVPAHIRKNLQTLQRKRLDRYLLLSAIILTVGMAYQITMLNWPSHVITDESKLMNFNALTESISLYFGVNYSILIASYYLPVATIQSARRLKISSDTPITSNPKSGKSPWSNMSNVFAILSPTLTSLLPMVFGMFEQLPSGV